jgi:hypothetical protein
MTAIIETLKGVSLVVRRHICPLIRFGAVPSAIMAASLVFLPYSPYLAEGAFAYGQYGNGAAAWG